MNLDWDSPSLLDNPVRRVSVPDIHWWNSIEMAEPVQGRDYHIALTARTREAVPATSSLHIYCDGHLVHEGDYHLSDVWYQTTYIGAVEFSESGCTFTEVGAIILP